MDIADVLSTGGLVISGAAVAQLANIGVKAWSARNQKTEVSGQPLRVVAEPKYVHESDLAKALDNQDALNREMFSRLGHVEQRVANAEGCSKLMQQDVTEIKGDIKIILRALPRR